MLKKFVFLWICLAVIFGCSGCERGYQMRENPIKWAKLMADAYLQKCDSSLTNYSDRWLYDVAFLARTYDDLYQITHEQKYRNTFIEYMDFFVSDSAVWSYKIEDYNLDRVQPARNLFLMYDITKEERYKNAISYFVQQLSDQPRNEDSGYWYKKIYPNQMWVDEVYMACPFMALYAKTYNEPAWYDEAVKQITLTYEHTRDPQSGLLYQAWDQSKQQAWCNPETGQSPNFWGRGMGLFCAGVIDVLDYLPKDHPSRPQLIQILQETTAALLKVQDPNYKMWFQVLDKGMTTGNYMEMSCTQLFIYTLAKGARLGYLPEEYREIAKKAYDYSIRLGTKWYYPDGSGIFNVYYISANCLLGKVGEKYNDGSFEYYTNVAIRSNDPTGTAPLMAASLELARDF